MSRTFPFSFSSNKIFCAKSLTVYPGSGFYRAFVCLNCLLRSWFDWVRSYGTEANVPRKSVDIPVF